MDTISELIEKNPEQFCEWKHGIAFPANQLSMGAWVSGAYRARDGSEKYCLWIDMNDTEPPSLWARFTMRLQGWTWKPK